MTRWAKRISTARHLHQLHVIITHSSSRSLHQVRQQLLKITGSVRRIAAGTSARAHLHGAADGFDVDAGAGTNVRALLLLPLRVLLLLLLLMMIPQAGSEGGTERLLLHLLLHSDGALRVGARVPEQDVTKRQ